MKEDSINSGRVQKAPENFLTQSGIKEVFAEGKKGRRDFIRNAFAAAAAGAAAPMAMAQGNPVPVEGGDPNILNLPEHAVGLGQGVAVEGYGKPSKFEANLQRRQSPGLTQTTQASVSFAPLQSLFGIVTPSGLHFERHHQGWWDIDPSKHRLMVNGMVKASKVFTVDEIMRHRRQIEMIDADLPDNRSMVINGPPALALHRWTDKGLVTFFDIVEDYEVLARFDGKMQGLVRHLIDERPE